MIIAIVVVGIVFSTSGFGGVPYVTIALALMFSIYAAIKKSLTIDSIVSTTSEILMMVPVALLFILFFRLFFLHCSRWILFFQPRYIYLFFNRRSCLFFRLLMFLH